jgi:hypothetical protein
MIIVTGTKRSGTSMWMQILKAAGFPVLGRAFPRDWSETIRAANPEGFYESPLRHGIHARTNPDPRTGVFLAPHATRRHAVKVFAQGLARTDQAYADFVIASVRDPHEYASSLARLYALEHDNKLARAERYGRSPASVPYLSFAPALLEWWHDNVTLLCDAARRAYPVRFVSYAAVLAEPEREVPQVLSWLGAGDIAYALQAVKCQLRTQRREEGDDASARADGPARLVRSCEELYQRLCWGTALQRSFLRRVERVHQLLLPRIRAAEQAARAARRRERARVRAQRAVPCDSGGRLAVPSPSGRAREGKQRSA